MALFPPEVWLSIVLGAGAAGVAYYAYSSHRIGKHFGIVSVPYAAIYAALLVTTFAPTIQSVDRDVAVVMALVSWGLYSHTLMRSRTVKRHVAVQVALIAVGFFALVVFPLLHLLVPEAETAYTFTIVWLYRLAAVLGWVAGARPGFGPKK